MFSVGSKTLPTENRAVPRMFNVNEKVKNKTAKLKFSANYITAARIVGTAALLFLPVLKFPFYVLYALIGITDVLDGWYARRTGTASEFGARLDSVSDILFYGVMLLKLFPILLETLPVGLWLTAAAAVLLRVLSYVTAMLKFRKFASVHTYLNKLTGFTVFLIPFIIKTEFASVWCTAVCSVAVAAAAEELAIHIASKKYITNVKTVLSLSELH